MMKKSKYILIFIFLISIIGLSSCKKKNDDNKPSINNEICVLEKNIDENEMVEGELQLYTYAIYTFIPQEDGFYNCVISAICYDIEGNKSFDKIWPFWIKYPFEVGVKSQAISGDTFIDYSNQYFIKNNEYKIYIKFHEDDAKKNIKKEYKLMVSKASFDSEAFITTTEMQSTDFHQIIVVEDVIAGNYYLDNIDGLICYNVYDISDCNKERVARRMDTIYLENGVGYYFNKDEYVQRLSLDSNRIYAFDLLWKLDAFENKIVKPTLVKC